MVRFFGCGFSEGVGFMEGLFGTEDAEGWVSWVREVCWMGWGMGGRREGGGEGGIYRGEDGRGCMRSSRDILAFLYRCWRETQLTFSGDGLRKWSFRLWCSWFSTPIPGALFLAAEHLR